MLYHVSIPIVDEIFDFDPHLRVFLPLSRSWTFTHVYLDSEVHGMKNPFLPFPIKVMTDPKVNQDGDVSG